MSQATIGFFGAAETVTGSRHIITVNGKRILIDCGLFQGPREIRERNWEPFPIDPSVINAVVVTHGHMDHIGYLPKLIREGYRGPVYCTRATAGLARISLPDSGRLQEEDARHANKVGSRHKPALPLYTEEDAYASLKSFEPLKYNEFFKLPGGTQFRFLPAGHILGSAFVELYFESGERILMSGDLGRYDTPIIKDPTAVEFAEYLVIESTYGDRLHADENVAERLSEILNEAFQIGGAVIIPSFAIGRTQEVLFYLKQLQDSGGMPRMPIFIDSPMAMSATDLYANATDEHDEEMKIAVSSKDSPLDPKLLNYVRDRNQSKALNGHPGPLVIIAGSGMANGGRVVHHLKHRLSDPSTIVLFTGYQAQGTLGRRILEKEPTVRIHQQEIEVRARIEKLNSLSAHADQNEMMSWLGNFKTPPRRTFLVHGEPPAQATLRDRIVRDLGWDVQIPRHGESFEL